MATAELHPPVVVGTDGSPSSDVALAWAIGEARGRKVPLRIVLATHGSYGPGLTAASEAGGAWQTGTELLLDDIRDRVAAEAPDVPATAEARTGAPVTVLNDESRTAGLLVIGARGHGGFPALRIGSVPAQLSAITQCPLVIVPQPGIDSGPAGFAEDTVAVGVDGSATAMAALDFAFRFASRRDLGLSAIHVWTNPVGMGTGRGMAIVTDPAELAERAERTLAESMTGWGEWYPDVRVTRRLVQGHPAQELIREASAAQLLALGTRGRGGFRGLLLGSVSQAVIHHIPCPLVIVPPVRS